jgi:UDP-N-acetyl-D-mannosaminuronate dehydrogenase
MVFKKVSVIGLGYIGLPTAAVITSRGIDVVGVDVSENDVNTINQGKVHIIEPDLDMLVQAAVTLGKLRATLSRYKDDFIKTQDDKWSITNDDETKRLHQTSFMAE